MEELFGNSKLGELEEKIDTLIQTYRGVREEKEALTNRIGALEIENRELKEQIARIESDRDVVMGKVRNILEKIEKIEV
jgi:predicted  nucleic acid-binding Zn-ribbon protein